ncbi:MAG: hypothetical protein RQ847_03780 [Wenzhouxiangellaceae bacterium]|nr:hypothetical protein [Wenzhouxiangellaceae bacterium]
MTSLTGHRDPLRSLATPLAWALIIAIGAGLRLWHIGDQILIDDEWHALDKLMWAGYQDIFLSFGVADYSIPLTLLFNLLAETIGLTEWRMRALPLLGGTATIILLPLLLRPWLKRDAQLLFGVLLAISPVLIHFSRYVRPYALTLPLGFIAVIALWRWWHEGGRGRAVAAWIAIVLAAWLHPLTLLFTGSALTWFGIAGLVEFHKRGDASHLLRLVTLGATAALATAALILPPLLADPWAMDVKAGVSQLETDTLIRAWELAAGTAQPAMLAAFSLLAIIGAVRLVRRDALFAGYWSFMLATAMLAIVLLQPAWIHHALALVRYTLIAMPMALALAALGTVRLAKRLVSALGIGHAATATVAVGVALVLGLYFNGPLPRVYQGVNQFTNHLRYQFDYDFERNPVAARMRTVPVPEAYRRIVREPGQWQLIEAPWHFESTFSPLSEYQRFHQLPVRIGMISGLCVDWTHGETRPDADLNIHLDEFVFLDQVIEKGATEPLFVVFHRDNPFQDVQVRTLPDIDACIERFRKAFGEPWHEDDRTIVFRLPVRGAVPGRP